MRCLLDEMISHLLDLRRVMKLLLTVLLRPNSVLHWIAVLSSIRSKANQDFTFDIENYARLLRSAPWGLNTAVLIQ